MTPASVFGMFGGYVAWGKPPARGTREIMLLYKRSPWFRAALSRMSFGVAITPWKLYAARAKATGKYFRRKDLQRATNSAHRRKLLDEAAKNGELDEITDHPMLDLLENFNPMMPGLVARSLVQTLMDLKGEAFLVIERNAQGMPVELYPMPPYWVTETPTLRRPTFRVSAIGWAGEIPETEVIWLRDLDPENPYGRGVGIGDALGDEAETDEYAAKYTKSFYYNDALPAGLVGIEGVTQKAQLDEAKQRWEDDHKGFLKSFRLHWHSGKLNFVQISPAFDAQKHTDLRKFERDTILQTIGFPPEILGILEHSNRATIDAADLILTKYGYVPRLELQRAFFQQRLAPEFDERLIVDYVSPVQEDREFKLKAVQVAPWSFTVNEIRGAAGEPPSDRPEDDELPDRPSGAPPMLDEGTAPVGTPLNPAPEPDAPKKPKKSRRAHATKGDDEDEVDHILEELRPQYLTSETQAEYQARVQKWAGDVLQELAQDPSFELLNPKVQEFVHEFALDRLAGKVNGTTRDDLRAELLEGIRAGEGIDDLSSRVEDVFAEAEGSRAEMIARTEVLRGANFASKTAYKISGVVGEKEWVATDDDRTRDSHAEMDGQVVGIDDDFTSPDGGTADYPGDFGDGDEDINCRCTVAPVIKDPGEEDAAPSGRTKAAAGHWKRFDVKVTPWEASMRADLRRGFAKQKAAVLAALHRVRGSR
jgi:SPP1 gp7 family putative phage head morphogenesis protein